MLFSKGQMAGLQSEAEEAEGKVARMEQEEGELRTKVINLETFLQNYPPNSIQELKVRYTSQSHTDYAKQSNANTQSCSVPFINSYVRVCFQDRALKHSSVLEGLLTWTQFQKQSIESQGQQLTKLQKLVGIIAEHSLKNAK